MNHVTAVTTRFYYARQQIVCNETRNSAFHLQYHENKNSTVFNIFLLMKFFDRRQKERRDVPTRYSYLPISNLKIGHCYLYRFKGHLVKDWNYSIFTFTWSVYLLEFPMTDKYSKKFPRHFNALFTNTSNIKIKKSKQVLCFRVAVVY